MGLDWEPLPTPKRGYEAEFIEVFGKLVSAKGSKRDTLSARFENISEPAFATLGAPRVGFDDSAETWLRARAEKSGRVAELDEIRREMHGYNVLELLPPCEGFPVYSNHVASESLERYAFRAELLSESRDELGVELCELAYTMMLPAEHSVFAERLLEVAEQFVADHELPDHVALTREPVYPEGSLERRGHILYAAAKWCWYWSRRGHGLGVWF